MTLLDHATTTARGAMPRVNLLPPEIEEHRRFSRLRLALVGTLVLTSTGVGGLYVFTDQATRGAAAELQAEQDRGAAVSGESAQYAAVPQLENETQAAETSLQTAMSQEVRWSFLLNELTTAMPADAWLTGVTMTQPLDATTPDAAAPVAGYAFVCALDTNRLSLCLSVIPPIPFGYLMNSLQLWADSERKVACVSGGGWTTISNWVVVICMLTRCCG